jgi:hypothetical protein
MSIHLCPEVTLRRSTDVIDIDCVPEPGDLLAQLRDESRGTGFAAARTPQGYRLRYDGLCDFDVSADLTEMTWKLTPEGDPGMVSVL